MLRVVTTITLEEDAPWACRAQGGDDDYLEEDALGSLLPSGDDDP